MKLRRASLSDGYQPSRVTMLGTGTMPTPLVKIYQ